VHSHAYKHTCVCVWVGDGNIWDNFQVLAYMSAFQYFVLIWWFRFEICWTLTNAGNSYPITSMGCSKNQWVANGRRSKWWWVFLLSSIYWKVHVTASVSELESFSSKHGLKIINSTCGFPLKEILNILVSEIFCLCNIYMNSYYIWRSHYLYPFPACGILELALKFDNKF
jgi:hypothetical protein